MNAEQINEILRKHHLWLDNEDGGERANLSEADLRRADLRRANLRRANLRGVDLRGANLSEADLGEADLSEANLRWADLSGVDLRGVDLRGANLSEADLGEADLSGAYLPSSLSVPDLHKKVADAVLRAGLDMHHWHSGCGTTHCRAGWAIHLAGEDGRKLEIELGSDVAGTVIYHNSTGMVPNFYCGNEEALADILKCASLEGSDER